MEEQEEGEYVSSSLASEKKKRSTSSEEGSLLSDKGKPAKLSASSEMGKQAKRIKLSLPKRKFYGCTPISEYSIQEKVGEGTFGYKFPFNYSIIEKFIVRYINRLGGRLL
jgi:hypothetical protein